MFGPVSEGMRLFRAGSSVAILGYSEDPKRVVNKITDYLTEEGCRIIGVNPKYVDNHQRPITVVAKLSDLEKPVDIIQIFRKSRSLPDIADEILALPWKPKMVWCQQGVVDILFQEQLERARIEVVMDACPYALRSYL